MSAPTVHTPDAVANEMLTLAWSQDRSLTPMKLLKLVYFAQGWHLGLTDTPLFEEDVQVWQYGPVVQSLYHEFKEFGANPITRKARELTWEPKAGLCTIEPMLEQIDRTEDTRFAKLLVARVWEIYGHYSGIQLSNLTHEAGSPWDQIARRYNYQVPNGLKIPKKLLAKYFRQKSQPVAA